MSNDRSAVRPEARPLNASTLPPGGMVFGVPITPKLFGACKVLAVRTPYDAGTPPHLRLYASFIAITRWTGAVRPDVVQVGMGRLLTDRNGEVQGIWIAEEAPADVNPIAVTMVTSDELVRVRDSWASWDWIFGTMRRELGLEQEMQAGTRLQGGSDTPAGFASGAGSVSSGKPFAAWEGFRPASVVREAQCVVYEAANALRALGPHATEGEKLAAIERAVIQFNELDEAHRFIDSIEREDIYDVLTRLAEEHAVRGKRRGRVLTTDKAHCRYKCQVMLKKR